MATLSGIVRDANGDLASQLVRVYRRDTGALVGQTMSNATTGAWSITTADTLRHFAIAQEGYFDNYWSSVVSALHMDDTGLTDKKGNTVTLNGNVSRSATQSKFGGYSAYFDGSGDYLSLPSHSNFNVSSSNFTISMWSYATATNGTLVSRRTSGAAGWVFATYGVRAYMNGAWSDTQLSWTEPSLNAWHFFELTRSGTTVEVAIDNTVVATKTSVSSIQDLSEALRIGVASNAGEAPFTGYIDDFLFTNGVARAHSLPTSAFVDGESGGSNNAIIKDLLTPA